MSGSRRASTPQADGASFRRGRIRGGRAAPGQDGFRERGFGARPYAAAGAVDIAESWTLLLWLWSWNSGQLAKLDEQAAAPARADLGSQSFAGGFGVLDVQLPGSSYDMPPAQVR